MDSDEHEATGIERVDALLEGAQPRSRDLAMEQARARLGAMLFGAPADPVKLGRFVILGRLGQGGMGVVYSAYDPELDRRVALKLLRSSAGSEPGSGSSAGRERLLREAQALARLSHPNIVAVHDVGILDDQVFVVMEFVVGQTLRAWVNEQPRTWREILAIYRQAGEGLAAAHAAGIVHRDFKPDNALVGSDNRVRVLDFGLARRRVSAPDDPLGSDAATGSHLADIRSGPGSIPGPEPTQAPGGSEDDAVAETMPAPRPQLRSGSNPGFVETPKHALLEQSLTADGAVMGTPAYMPPEQIDGHKVGPASDQYSFCASLYEALYGERPYEGKNLVHIRESMQAGKLREPPRGTSVPAWLFTALRRGLAVQESERYPSMRALLDELGRDPAVVWRRRVLVMALVVMSGISAYALARPAAPAQEPCTGAERELLGIWGPTQRTAIERALLATGQPYAAEAWGQIAEGLDTYARSWAHTHQDACLAHRRGEQSGSMLDKRMACLQARQQAMGSAVDVLTDIEASSLARAVEVVQKLPALSVCSDIEALSQDVPPPEDPAVAQKVTELRAQASHAKALEDMGRYEDAHAQAKRVALAAETVGYRPLLVEALLLQGRIGMNIRNPEKEAREPLHRAMLTGFATNMNTLALEALARWIYIDSMTGAPSAELPGYMAIAESLVEQIPGRGFVHALLLNNTAVVYQVRGERDTARAYYERAMAVRDAMGPERPLELVSIVQNLARHTTDNDRRLALLEQAARELENALGPSHPMTLSAYMVMATYIPGPARAHALLEPICERYLRFHPKSEYNILVCLSALAQLDAELGRGDVAARRLAQVVELSQDIAGPGVEIVRELARGYTRFYRGDYQTALEPWQSVITTLSSRPEQPWWIRRWIAEARLGIGASERRLGRVEAAIQTLEAAVVTLEGIEEKATATVRLLAWARMELAQALGRKAAGSPDTTTRTRMDQLLAQAEEWYREAGQGYEARVAEVMRLRRELGAGR